VSSWGNSQRLNIRWCAITMPKGTDGSSTPCTEALMPLGQTRPSHRRHPGTQTSSRRRASSASALLPVALSGDVHVWAGLRQAGRKGTRDPGLGTRVTAKRPRQAAPSPTRQSCPPVVGRADFFQPSIRCRRRRTHQITGFAPASSVGTVLGSAEAKPGTQVWRLVSRLAPG
jgi:hypothetical protein